MVFPTFESETLKSMEFGLKTDLMDGRARQIRLLFLQYENFNIKLLIQTHLKGGVANIPESEMSGLEVEFSALLSDSLSVDLNMAFLDSEVTSDYDVLDNVDAYQYFFGEEDLRYGLRENVKGNELAKSPDYTADLSNWSMRQKYHLAFFLHIFQWVHRGEFQQRVSNNAQLMQLTRMI